MSQPDDPAAGDNPEYGASLHYYLPEALEGDDEEAAEEEATAGAEAAQGTSAEAAQETSEGAEEAERPELVLTILAPDGDTVYTFDDLDRGAGLHRVHWNLRNERTREARLRTKPDENPHVDIPDRGWRVLPVGGRLSILMPPGEYEVRLKVGEAESARSLTVLKDPNSNGSESDVSAQMPVLESLYDAADRAAALINELEWLRVQLDDVRARIADAGLAPEAEEEIGASAEELERELKALEEHFFDLRHTGAGQDVLRWKRLLVSRIAYLARSINGSDYRPTDQQAALADELISQLESHEARFREIRSGPLQQFNRFLAEHEVPHVIVRSDD